MISRRDFLTRAAGLSAAALTVTLPETTLSQEPQGKNTIGFYGALPPEYIDDPHFTGRWHDDKEDAKRWVANRYLTDSDSWYIMTHRAPSLITSVHRGV